MSDLLLSSYSYSSSSSLDTLLTQTGNKQSISNWENGLTALPFIIIAT